uniref:Retrotransposon-related protein n=1 Tax=Tanacetum cinerariifolium TaxID=118510 RepID=A0A6L2NIB9_TANCI|nr:retrotransposon-related protein [Tanacetum cinerariifolium]
MVDIRTDNGGVLTGSKNVESQLTSLITDITHLADRMIALVNKLNGDGDTSQKKGNLRNQNGQNSCNGSDSSSFMGHVNDDDVSLGKGIRRNEKIVSIFINSLKPEIKEKIRIFKPKTLYDAYCVAILQESTNEFLRKSGSKNVDSNTLVLDVSDCLDSEGIEIVITIEKNDGKQDIGNDIKEEEVMELNNASEEINISIGMMGIRLMDCDDKVCYNARKGMHKGVKKFIREWMFVKDRLSKYAHIMALSHPYTASSVAQVFLDTVYKLHGLPSSIVSDRDTVFLSNFWRSLFKLLKVELKMSTAYHPQTDGQTEVVNKCLECFRRCMSGERPKEWVQWLPLAEFWYNTNKHSSIVVTPFEVVYGQTPPLHIPYLAGESVMEVVDRTLQAIEATIEMLKFHLKRSQDRMKNYADKKRSEREFEVGMWVYLKLQPHRQVTIRKEQQHKLSPKYYGPFMILAKVGAVAYKLELPNAILDRRMAKLNDKAVVYVLVKWATQNEENATWELYNDLVQRFPDFQIDS